jgi:1-acyl-sn-glycerol-3-phosphate acyltransferase
LKPGFITLARRSRAALLPVGLDGAYDAWPRRSRLPLPAVVHVCLGDPILPAEVASLTDDQLIAELETRIRQCHAEARRGRSA